MHLRFDVEVPFVSHGALCFFAVGEVQCPALKIILCRGSVNLCEKEHWRMGPTWEETCRLLQERSRPVVHLQ